ncbi:MAG: fused MFS/spermidine synthase, partial [bacterium]
KAGKRFAKETIEESKATEPTVKATSTEKVVLVGFLATGLAALSAEVIWTRVLTLVVGTTVYAFSIMLIAFLLGLAIGTAIFAKFAQRTSRPGTALSLVVLAIGLSVFISMVLFGKMPFAYMRLYESVGKTWGSLVWVQLLLSLSLVLISTFLMGGIFPLVARIYATDEKRVGNRIGTAYAFNTIGCIAGSLMGSFVFLRFLGVRGGMALVSAIYVGVGLLLWFTVAERLRNALRFAIGLAIVACAILLATFSPPWDKKVMTSGIYVYAPLYGKMENFLSDLEIRNLLFYNEGPGATVSIDRVHNVLSMRIDGKTDASSGSDMITQELISHLPLLFHPNPDTVLLIGLGSGVSLSSALTHPIKHIECVELLENVITAAHYFDHLTNSCMNDPRAYVFVGDGRNHVFLSRSTYDVIISQPTNPWISGVGDLFTLEFFAKARERLKPDGIMCAWFQTYHMGEEELKSVFKTFMEVFPNVVLWFSNESDVILLGSIRPIDIKEDLISRMERPEVKDDLARVGIDEVEDILSALLLDGAALAEFTRGQVRIHTDDNMILEYQASRKIVEATYLAHLVNFSSLYRARGFPDLPASINNSVSQRMIARSITMRGTIEALRGNAASAISLYDQAYSIAPEDPYVRGKFAETHLRIADAYFARGEYDKAFEEYKKATVDRYYIDAWIAFDGLGLVQMMQEDYESARMSLEEACNLNPYSADSYYNLGLVLIALEDSSSALDAYEHAYKLKPDDPDIAAAVAWYNAVLGKDLDKALRIAQGLVEKERNAICLDALGWIYFLKGDIDQAVKILEEAVNMDKDYVDAVYHLAIAVQAKGDSLAAKHLLRRVTNLDKGELGEKAREFLESDGEAVE